VSGGIAHLLGHRINSTSTRTDGATADHERSVVTAFTPSRRASARQARSPQRQAGCARHRQEQAGCIGQFGIEGDEFHPQAVQHVANVCFLCAVAREVPTTSATLTVAMALSATIGSTRSAPVS